MISRGTNVFKSITKQPQTRDDATNNTSVNDFFLHALFARLTLTNNRVIEFDTKFNHSTNTIELQIKDQDLKFFDQLLGIQRGPKFKTFIDWLIGSRQLTTSTLVPDFISISAFDIWYGANESIVNDIPVVIPSTINPSHIGYNLKVKSGTTKIRVHLSWLYIGGANTSFTLRVNAAIVSTSTPINIVNDVIIPTIGIANGDNVETAVLDIDTEDNTIIGVSIQRNCDGSTDPHTEIIGLIGMRVEEVS